MGNVPIKRSPSRTGTTQLKRSQSMAPPRRRPSIHESNGVQKSSESSNSIGRKSKAFLSNTNIAGGSMNPYIDNQQLSHPAPERYILTSPQRDMIRSNWEANRDRRYDISRRIYGRAFNKRPDIREIYERIGVDLWSDEANKFADFIELIMDHLDDLCTLERVCLELGRRHGDWRQQGFKPEFWVALAESMTKECCYLDAAVHPAGEVLEAWSKLVALIFGWCRDGYYEAVRIQRRLSRKVVTKSASISSRSLSNSDRSDSIDDQTHVNTAALPRTPETEIFGTPTSDAGTIITT